MIRRAAVVAAMLLTVFALTAPSASAAGFFNYGGSSYSSSSFSWFGGWFSSAFNFAKTPVQAPFAVCGALTAHPYCGFF